MRREEDWVLLAKTWVGRGVAKDGPVSYKVLAWGNHKAQAILLQVIPSLLSLFPVLPPLFLSPSLSFLVNTHFVFLKHPVGDHCVYF